MEASILACLSIEWLNTSYTVAYVMAAASTVVVVACLVVEVRRKRFSWLAVYAPLLILQPAWRLAWGEITRHGLRPMSSDCGFGNRGESIFLTAVLVAVLVVLVRGHLSKRLFLLRLAIICWVIWMLVIPLAWFGLLYFLPAQVEGTVVGGAAACASYALILTLISAVLYIFERLRRRTQGT